MLKIAVFVKQVPEDGGGFQYELTLCSILQEKFNNLEITYLSSDERVIAGFAKFGILVKLIKVSILDKIHKVLSENFYISKAIIKLGFKYSTLEKYLIKNKTDLVYFLSPNIISSYLSELNYIMTIWDLCHRDHFEFPEVRNNHEFETREKFLNTNLKKAVAVIVDSELGKQNIITRYGIDNARIKIIPFIPSQNIIKEQESIDIKKKYNLETNYVFYPAQFWAHKNHIYILDALHLLKDRYNIKLYALFSGSDKGNMQYIKKYANNLGVLEQIKFVGFVTNQELHSLYKQALALVMPTYFGPTNLPPLEAFQLQCPVCYSDLSGLREQAGDAAFLLDLNNPDSLVQQLRIIIANSQLVETKVKSGLKLVQDIDLERASKELSSIINDFRLKRKLWE